MFVFLAVGGLAVVALLVLLAVQLVNAAVAARRRRERIALHARARWEAHHYSLESRTWVVVRRVAYRRGEPFVFETVTVSEIANDRADWYDQLQSAMAEARERAALLSLQHG
ncbi:hypothetical protein [Protofrankia symbiont of Coriaria ruscifolia]|uniref:hypothetical protein n=1 Tax=Protofrankia symbiont of Coriaria ruscifolia TaxID=1306542 RepID=UPI001040FFC8|nr:hypothetical protein [Protofrankia symbiont of Coriaria ruscifolia]